MTDLRATLADLVSELVDPYEHAETIHLRSAIPDGRPTQEIRIHRVQFPSLLDQLAAAIEPSGGIGVARGYESSPAAALDAIDLLGEIETAATLWTPRGDDTAHRLRALVGRQLTDKQFGDLIRIIRRWVTAARVVTRHERPAIRPRGSCPACNSRGSIRVRVEPATALCVDCRQTWEGDAEISVLAKHIRWSNRETESTEGVAA